ncbi:Lrp/AsnC family transcriptional regulator [Terasakiella sp. A23]|uniref:Lrp/AsnC family transcriptional regulator n=1 Tax=Terasakiella sp. FCG-A23 TaxID=3080561 RepID=UPI0029551322|nr:Lrp/AsnC family transcriptional regulator [Terasakiella sp. A23]MDV7338447.1 Lrp/AsnC family transcriptional regulator [Terasakiella sp. A23]
MEALDATDRKILTLLQRDGRMSNADLAETINLSPSACLRRVKRLEDDGFIDGYVMLLNQAAVGKPTNVFVEITLGNLGEDVVDAFEHAVKDCPDVRGCYFMSGDADYLLRIACAGPEGFEQIHRNYLSRLPGVTRIRSSFALRTVFKKTGVKVDNI